MRIRRYLLAIAMVTTGAVMARPDDVLPLASRLAAPLLAKSPAPTVVAQAAVTPEPSSVLPDFVTTGHALSFPAKSAKPSAGKGDASQSAALSDAPSPAQIVPIVPDDTGADADAGGPPASYDGAKPEAVSSEPVRETAAIADPAPPAAKSSATPAATVAATTPPGGTAAPADAPPPAPPLIPAKTLFGAAKGPSLLQARAIGTYSRGCLAGAVALPVDGPAWQAMRLSRNRNWGHPKLVGLVEKLATTAQKDDGWPGLLVGDLAQPRGGPMVSGHASHQLGLDADVWLTPMPDRKLTRAERENISATSMLDKTDLAVDPNVFTDKHVKLIKRAASFPEVERVLVHPAIKKALCQSAAGTLDRGWLGKVRPIQGHYYHFHVRIGCPPGSAGCVSQKAVTGEDGCTKEVDEWLARLQRAKQPAPPRPPGWKPAPSVPKREIALTQLPADCRMVLESGPDGVAVPPEALLPAPARTAKSAKGKKREPLVKATVTLRPVRERRAEKR